MYKELAHYNKEGTVLRKAQHRLLEMLEELDRICKKHNLTYWLDSGTAIGAYRHKGFIPWDDDIDIALFREDYLKLVKILRKELPDHFALQNRKTEKYFHMVYSRIIDKNSFVDYGNNKALFRKHFKYQGLFLDIFFIEKGNPKIKRYVDFFYYRAFTYLSPNSTIYKNLIAKIFWPIISVLLYTIRKISCVFVQNSYIYGYGIPYKDQFHVKEIVPVKPIIFEGINVSGPRDIHAFLKRNFGDYMEIPSKEKRLTHAEKIKVYKQSNGQ